MSKDEFSICTCCGFIILALLEFFELGVFITGAVYLNSPVNCVGGAGHVSLPTWLFVGGLVGFIFNMIFMCFYMINHVLCESGSREPIDEICTTFFCCVVGAPVAIFLVVSLMFRLAWFIVGLFLYGNLPEMCKNDLNSLFSLGIVFFVAMVASSVAKLMVVSKKCSTNK